LHRLSDCKLIGHLTLGLLSHSPQAEACGE